MQSQSCRLDGRGSVGLFGKTAVSHLDLSIATMTASRFISCFSAPAYGQPSVHPRTIPEACRRLSLLLADQAGYHLGDIPETSRAEFHGPFCEPSVHFDGMQGFVVGFRRAFAERIISEESNSWMFICKPQRDGATKPFLHSLGNQLIVYMSTDFEVRRR